MEGGCSRTHKGCCFAELMQFGLVLQLNRFFNRQARFVFGSYYTRPSAHDIFVDLLMNRPEQNSTPTKL